MALEKNSVKKHESGRRLLKFSGWTVAGIVVAALISADLGQMGVRGFPQTYIIRSGSMTGTFGTGSLVWDTPIHNGTNFHPGEIVTFRNPTIPSEVLTHQIIAVYPKAHEIQTKGVANPAKDPFVTPYNNVMGEYEGHIPDLGYVISFIQNRWLWLLIMLSCSLGIFGLVRWVVVDGLKEKEA